ncbi:hypothetical protein PG984_011903 [Apiospora sp. TS-2023a]
MQLLRSDSPMLYPKEAFAGVLRSEARITPSHRNNLASDGSTPGQPSAVFKAAKEGFLDTLSTAERSQFSALCDKASPEQLLDSLTPFSRRFKKERWGKAFEKIQGFTEALEPYFDVVNIVISSHPELAAIVWGAFRLVLQMAGNFSSFFEKLADLLTDLKRMIPRFKDLVDLFAAKAFVSPRILPIVQDFYSDIFLLLCSVAQVFTKKDGTIKRTPVVVAQLMWQPFTVKFGNIKKRFQCHMDNVFEKIELLHLHRIAQNDEAMARQQQQIQSVLDTSVAQAATANDTAQRVQEVCAEVKRLEERLEHDQRNTTKYSQVLSQSFDQNLADAGRLRNDIMNFIQPPDFIQEYERGHSLRDPESGAWLLTSHQFLSWKSAATQMLWIKGKPGCGKSVLASTIIDTLGTSTVEGVEARNVLYFFYKSNEGLTTMDQMYRSLLAQIVDSRFDPQAAETSIEYALSSRQQGQIRGSPLTIRDLFFILLGRFPGFYIVVDAIDECQPKDRYEEHDQALRQELQIFYDGVVSTGTRLAVLSRPNVWGLSNLSTAQPMQSVSITPAMLSEDLRQYCLRGLCDLCDNGFLPPMEPEPLGDLCSTLLMGADGMFLWVRLMFSYLRSPVLAPPSFAPRVRLQAIRDLRYPESLDQVYCRILSLIGAMPAYRRHLARQVIKWLLFPKSQHLGALELHTILTAAFYFDSGNSTSLIHSSESQDLVDQDFAEFSQTILLACSSLVELSTTNSQQHYRLIHATTSEFFLSRLYSEDCSGINLMQPSVRQYFQLCQSETEMELGIDCLRYLHTFVPTRPLSSNIQKGADREEVARKYGFAAYSSAAWTAHLKHAKVFQGCGHPSFETNRTALMQSVQQLLGWQLKVNSWVELLYLLGTPATNASQHGNVRESIPSIAGREVQSPLPPDFYECLTRLSRDLERLEEDWGEPLRAEPHQIWNDVTAFFPSLSFKKTTATTVRHIGLDDPLDSSQSTKPLAVVSMSDPTQLYLTKLSIWPSRQFERLWPEHMTDWLELVESCRGWTARYQLWNTSSDVPQLLQEYSVRLDDMEVLIQVHHFLRRSPKFTPSAGLYQGEQSNSYKELQLGFPILMSRHDLNTFVILRTLYKLVRVGASPGDVRVHSFVIPLNFHPNLARVWEPGWGAYPYYGQSSDLIYDYGFEFGGQGRYLLYRDTTALDDMPKRGETFASTLALFELGTLVLPPRAGREPIRFLNSLVREPGCVPFTHWTFHPTLPILAVHLAGSCAASLWGFTEGVSYELPKVPGRRNLRSLSFSSCGTNLIVDGTMDEYPSVQPITDLPIYKKLHTPDDGKIQVQDAQISTKVTLRQDFVSNGTLVCSDLSGGGTLQSRQTQQLISQDGQTIFHSLQVTTSSAVNVLEATQRRGGESSTQTFLSLPGVDSVDYLDASVRFPAATGTGAECLRVILNKNPQPRYSMADRPDRNFPALVIKDPRAIPRGRKRAIEGSDGRLEEGAGMVKHHRVDEKEQ